MNYTLFDHAPSIIPDRYVWHLSSVRNRYSILEHGILPYPRIDGLLYVNNQIDNPHNLWPIVFDDSGYYFDWASYDDEEKASLALMEQKLASYDYWRVDSNIAGYHGYHIDPNDPVFSGQMFGSTATDEDYICRREPIPVEALKLFRYQPGTYAGYRQFFTSEKPVLKYEQVDGVVTVGGFDKANPFYLEEVERVCIIKHIKYNQYGKQNF